MYIPHFVYPFIYWWTLGLLLPFGYCEVMCKANSTEVWNSGVESASTLNLKVRWGTSLVAQWLRIRLPMQGTQVQSLVQEDPTCCRATKLLCHNYWACALEPASHNYWAHAPQLLKPLRPRACAATTETESCNYWSPRALSLCSATREATAMRSPRTATQSSPHPGAATKTQCSQKKKKRKKRKWDES